MKLVNFRRDWADEFDVYGFALMTTETWNEYSEKLKKTDRICWGFGTNQDFDDYDGDDFLKSMEVTDVSLETANILREVFKLRKRGDMETWGHFPDDPFPEDDEDDLEDEW